MLEVHGNKCKVRRADGTIVSNVHFGDALVMPTSEYDHDSSPLQFEEAEDEVYVDAVRRSPGLILDDGGRTKAETEESLQQNRVKLGKLEKITQGTFIAYTGSGGPKKCNIGKVLNVSKREASVLVHKHRPSSAGHMRVKWEPMFHEGAVEVLGTGPTPSTEKVDVENIVDMVQLHDGVLAHAAARRLDHKKFTWAEEAVLPKLSVQADLSRDATAHEERDPGEECSGAVQAMLALPMFRGETNPEIYPRTAALDPHLARILEHAPVD